MALKDSLTATATKLINKFGNSVVLTEVTIPDSSDYTPSSGSIPQTITPHNIKAYLSQISTAQLSIGRSGTSQAELGLYGIEDFNAKFVFDGDVTKIWLIDGAEIISLNKTSIQDGIIVWDAVCRK